jgi:hypothetical protein
MTTMTTMPRLHRPVFGHFFGIPKEKPDPISSSTTARSLVASDNNEDEDQVVIVSKAKGSRTVSNTTTTTTTTVSLLPDYAWALHEICTRGIQRRNFVLNIMYNAPIVLGTVVATTAAVLYGRYYEGYPIVELVPSECNDTTSVVIVPCMLVQDWGQLTTFAATVILPLFIAVLIVRRDHLLQQPFRLPRALAMLEMEMFKFRTKTGVYRVSTTCQRRAVLATKLEDLWNDIIRHDATVLGSGKRWTSNIKKDDEHQVDEISISNKHISLFGSRSCAWLINGVCGVLRSTEHGDKENNEIILGQKQHQQLQQQPQKPGYKKKNTTSLPNLGPLHESMETDFLLFAELPSVSFDSHSSRDKNSNAAEAQVPTKATWPKEEARPAASAIIVPKYYGTVLVRDKKSPAVVTSIGDEHDEEANELNEDHNDYINDDGYSELSPELYMTVRIQTFYTKQSARVKSWQAIQDCSERGIQLLTLSASVTALVSYQWTIPMIMAVSAALTQVLEIRNYRKSIVSTRQVLQQLDDLQERYKTSTITTNNSKKKDATDTGNEKAWDSHVKAAEEIILQAEL